MRLRTIIYKDESDSMLYELTDEYRLSDRFLVKLGAEIITMTTKEIHARYREGDFPNIRGVEHYENVDLGSDQWWELFSQHQGENVMNEYFEANKDIFPNYGKLSTDGWMLGKIHMIAAADARSQELEYQRVAKDITDNGTQYLAYQNGTDEGAFYIMPQLPGFDQAKFWQKIKSRPAIQPDYDGIQKELKEEMRNSQIFTLDGSEVKGVNIVDKLSAINQAVNVYRNDPSLRWQPILTTDTGGKLNILETLQEAADFCKMNIEETISMQNAFETLLARHDQNYKSAKDEYFDQIYNGKYRDDAQKFWQIWERYWDSQVVDLKAEFDGVLGANREMRIVKFDDIEKERQRIKERIEALAAERRRHIVGALDEQGSHLDASCDDQQVAVAEVSAIKQAGHIALDLADTIGKIRALEIEYREKLLKVEVHNSPDWQIGGVSGGGTITLPWQASGDTRRRDLNLNAKVYNPTTTDMSLGPIVIRLGPPAAITNGWRVEPAPSQADSSVTPYRESEITLPYGIHKLEVSAYNACGPSDLHVMIENPKALIGDETFQTVGKPEAEWITENAVTKVTADGLVIVDDDDDQEHIVLSQKLALKSSARYDVECNAFTTRGDRISYLSVRFLDSDKKNIDVVGNNDMPLRGWLGYGTYAYYGVMGQVLPADKNEGVFKFSFGFGAAEVPANAVYFQLAAMINWRGTSETETTLSRYQVYELEDLYL